VVSIELLQKSGDSPWGEDAMPRDKRTTGGKLGKSFGKGWIVYSESYPSGERKLISIMPTTRSGPDVQRYLEKVYIDRHGSLEEWLHFKNHPNASPFIAHQESWNSRMFYAGHASKKS
jgi:hypothetical protein